MVITGVGGILGSTAAEYFHGRGYIIVGIDNDLRGKLLGDPSASTQWNIDRLGGSLRNFVNYSLDVRDEDGVEKALRQHARDVKAVIHCAAQPAHEGNVREDFEINAVGTLNMLDLWYRLFPEARFIYSSTIKVYGSYPCMLEYDVLPTRFDLAASNKHHQGFDESIPLDQGMSSFFGRSKTTADLYVQEYIHEYGLKGACFRASCITGGMHSGSEAHGMLSYLMRCAYTETPYCIYGYDGLQVRDQIHAIDLVRAYERVIDDPKESIVYNIGGGRANACSVLEAIDACERITGKKMTYSHGPGRTGDHPWWVTDNSRFMSDYPDWSINLSLEQIYDDIYEVGSRRW